MPQQPALKTGSENQSKYWYIRKNNIGRRKGLLLLFQEINATLLSSDAFQNKIAVIRSPEEPKWGVDIDFLRQGVPESGDQSQTSLVTCVHQSYLRAAAGGKFIGDEVGPVVLKLFRSLLMNAGIFPDLDREDWVQILPLPWSVLSALGRIAI